MKPKNILTTLGSLMVSALIAHAQGDSPSPAAPEPQPAPPATQPAAPAPTPAPAPEAQPAAPAPAPAPAAEAQPAAPAAATTAQPAAPAAQASPSAVIPLIVIEDTPLLDAIRNLARQAGINLMIDPRVGYGQPGPDGKPSVQPNVSIRWENVTAEQAFNALLGNYGLQAVEDPKVKITRITVKDPTAPDPIVPKTIQLQYASPSNVLAAVTATLYDKRSKVVPDARTSQLVVVATEKELVEVDKLVARLDSPTKEVLIEARLVETSMNPQSIKGIDWTGTLAKQHLNFGNNPNGSVTMNDAGHDMPGVPAGLAASGMFGFNPAAAFLSADGLSAVLSFLNTSTESKILSSPRTVTLDNEPAHIEAGTLFPIVNVTAGTANTTGGSQVAYSNLTVRLDVTPRISANNLINLRVQPSVMRLDHTETVSAGTAVPFEVPVFATRAIDTRVLIPSGNTLVMGGLIADQETRGNTKVPILGDLPVLGLAFRSDSKERNKQNLIVFVTPTIVQDQDFQPTKSDYLQTPVPLNDEGAAEWSAWDSGKPRDWSKAGVKGGAVKDQW
jgi:type II secretory pathway component GspD/PulD (secretin)